MNKSELVDAIAEESGLTKKAAGDAVNALINEVTKTLKAGTKVTIPGFLTFDVAERAAREGRNPSTGATIKLPAKKVVKVKAGKTIAEEVNA